MASETKKMSSAKLLLGKALNIPPDSIPNDATINSLVSWDSLGHMRLILETEAHLGITLSPTQILSMTSIAEIERLVAGHKAT